MNKLIKEYKDKIKNCDAEISKLTEKIRFVRNKSLTPNEYIEKTSQFVKDRKTYNTQKQCYAKSIVYLESVND